MYKHLWFGYHTLNNWCLGTCMANRASQTGIYLEVISYVYMGRVGNIYWQSRPFMYIIVYILHPLYVIWSQTFRWDPSVIYVPLYAPLIMIALMLLCVWYPFLLWGFQEISFKGSFHIYWDNKPCLFHWCLELPLSTTTCPAIHLSLPGNYISWVSWGFALLSCVNCPHQ